MIEFSLKVLFLLLVVMVAERLFLPCMHARMSMGIPGRDAVTVPHYTTCGVARSTSWFDFQRWSPQYVIQAIRSKRRNPWSRHLWIGKSTQAFFFIHLLILSFSWQGFFSPLEKYLSLSPGAVFARSNANPSYYCLLSFLAPLSFNKREIFWASNPVVDTCDWLWTTPHWKFKVLSEFIYIIENAVVKQLENEVLLYNRHRNRPLWPFATYIWIERKLEIFIYTRSLQFKESLGNAK